MATPRKTKTGNDTSIINGYLYFEDCKQFAVDSELFAEEIECPSTKAIRVISLSYQWEQREWVGSELMVGELPVDMTLRKEKRGLKNHWYAYRRFAGKLYKRYVGTSDQVTEARLLEVAKKLPAISHLKAV